MMEKIPTEPKELLNACIIIVLITGTVGIALKFVALFDKWIYWPSIPNVLDATFLIIAVVYLGIKAFKNR